MEQYDQYIPSKHSNEVQEIFDRVPGWLIRSGNLFFVLFFAIIFGVSWIIKYPSLIQTSLRVSSDNKLKSIKARVDGKVSHLMVKDGDNVHQNQILAIVESSADPYEVIKFSKNIDLLLSMSNNQLSDEQLQSFSNLGELQVTYQALFAAYTQYLATINGGFLALKKRNLEGQLIQLKDINENLKKQLADYEKDYKIEKSLYTVNEKLARQRVIAPVELKQAESRLISKELPIKQNQTDIMNNQTAQMELESKIDEQSKLLQEQRQAFYQILRTTKSAIDEWKLKYLLVAPANGKIYYTGFLQENQNVSAKQELFYIGGQSNKKYGELKIPQYMFGKIKPGQRVMVKFNGYPYEEFGYVEGKLNYISEVPVNDTVFLAKVSFPNGFRTNFNKLIKPREGLIGSAEIVTNDARLLTRVLNGFTKMFSR